MTYHSRRLYHTILSASLMIAAFFIAGAGRAVPALTHNIPTAARDTSGPDSSLPPMGWNSWNWFGKPHINEQVVREVIDAMVNEGLRDAGYQYVIVDGGWRDTALDASGKLLPNPVRFPHGIKALADYAHSKGLKFGLHTVPGTMDCGGDRVGGYGHEEVQVKQFADWGIDFIKLDKCKMDNGWNEEVLKATYMKWSRLLRNCGRDIVLSISAYKFRDWNPEVGRMSRTTGDISSRIHGAAYFDSVPANKIHASVMGIAEKNSLSAQYAGHGYWNDPDMLVTGEQGLSQAEQKVHFALWCIMSAPLFLGDDPRRMTRAEKDIVLSRTCIRIDQDPTEQGVRIAKNGYAEIWAKHLKDGSIAVLLLNRDPYNDRQVTLDFGTIGFHGKVQVRDIYAESNMGTFTRQFSRAIAPQSGLFLLITKGR